MQKLVQKLIKIVIPFLLLFVLFVTSCTKVNTGNVGVITHFGAVQQGTLTSGIHFTRPWPFASVQQVNTQLGKTEDIALGSSHDLQKVTTKVAIQWLVSPSSAPSMVEGIGSLDNIEEEILKPAIQEVVKAVSSNYTAEELVTQRTAAKLAVEKQLAEFVHKSLSKKNAVGAIVIANVAITDFQFSKEFDDSIEAKVKAEQDSLRAENEKKTKITQAEAKAQEVQLAAQAEAGRIKLSADADAYAIEANSKARAAAILREAQALNSNASLVQLRIAERWDGKLPTYTGNTIPMLQLKQ